MGSLRPLMLTVAVALSLVTAAPCRADEQKEARDAYDRGTRAFERGDFVSAARDFALADALAPHTVALKWALAAAVRADDAVLGMTLVDRSQRAPVDPPGFCGVRGAGALLSSRRGRPVPLSRAHAVPGWIDRVPASVDATTYVTPGAHAVELSSGSQIERRIVDAPAGGPPIELVPSIALAPSVPPGAVLAPPGAPIPRPDVRPPPPERPESGGGIHPGWFWASAVVTAGVAGVTIASGVDALAKHDQYLETRTPGGDQDGRAAQGRTNVLIGVTGVVALTTLLIGVFAVDWDGAPVRAARSGGAWTF